MALFFVARVGGQFLAVAGLSALLSPTRPGNWTVAACVCHPGRPAGAVVHAGPAVDSRFLVLFPALGPAAPGRAFFVLTAAECARGPLCPGVGNGNFADAEPAAAPPGDSDPPNTAVGYCRLLKYSSRIDGSNRRRWKNLPNFAAMATLQFTETI